MAIFLYFLNGFYHGLGADHLMAVTLTVKQGGSWRKVALLGLRFGLGHMAVLAGLGMVALLSNYSVPAAWESGAERLAGAVLVLLGVWTLIEWLKDVGFIHSHHHTHSGGKGHRHFHFHFQSRHPHPESHVHPHLSTALGAIFALSGIRSLLLGVVPVLQAGSLLWGGLYVLMFGAGIISCMTIYGAVAGSALNPARRSHVISLLLGGTSILLGIYWILSS